MEERIVKRTSARLSRIEEAVRRGQTYHRDLHENFADVFPDYALPFLPSGDVSDIHAFAPVGNGPLALIGECVKEWYDDIEFEKSPDGGVQPNEVGVKPPDVGNGWVVIREDRKRYKRVVSKLQGYISKIGGVSETVWTEIMKDVECLFVRNGGIKYCSVEFWHVKFEREVVETIRTLNNLDPKKRRARFIVDCITHVAQIFLYLQGVDVKNL